MLGRVAAFLLSLSVLSVSSSGQCTFSPVYSAQFGTSILDIAIDNNDLWAATSYGVSLYDRSIDPPRLVLSIGLPGVTRVVRVANGTVYAGSGTAIVLIRNRQIVSAFDAGATVNDLVVTPVYIFAATSNGLRQIDPLSPANAQTLATSSPNVSSLALSNTTLYAADGGGSLEKCSIRARVRATG